MNNNITYYIDESGSTGDLIPSKFKEQPFFVLGCIGIKDCNYNDIQEKFYDLKKQHKIQSDEIKAKAIYTNKLQFTKDLIDYMLANDVQILVELVDKKAQILIDVIEHMVLPTHLASKEIREISICLNQNVFLPYLYDKLDENFLEDFSKVCQNPSEIELLRLFDELRKNLQKQKDKTGSRILKSIEKTMCIFYNMKKYKDLSREAYTFFLPLPDTNKKGELIGQLPNIGCYTNIYARINKIKNRAISDIKIIHDEHAHFDQIIKNYHSEMKNLARSSIFINSDFNFEQEANLIFEKSKDNIGIQMADLISGICMRYTKDFFNKKDNSTAKEIVQAICLQNKSVLGLGLNFVSEISRTNSFFKHMGL